MGAAASVAMAALCASTAELLLSFPLDAVKTRLQAQGADAGVGSGGGGGNSGGRLRGGSTRFRSAYHCAVVTVQREGWGALYQGLPCAVAQGLVWALVLLGAEGWLRAATGATLFSPLRFLCACSLLGLLETLLLCPLDLLKARLQVKGPRRAHSLSSGALGALGGLVGGGALGRYGVPGGGPPDALQRLVVWGERQGSAAQRAAREVSAARGWGGLYLGWVYHFLKETIGAMALLGVYDVALAMSGGESSRMEHGGVCNLCSLLGALLGVYDIALAMSGGESSRMEHRAGGRHVHPQGLHWLHLWPTTCLAAVAYHVASYPFDTLKTRVQTDSLSLPRYRNSLQAAVMAYRGQGLGELYQGLPASLCRAVPGSAVKVLVFEVCLAVLTALAAVPWKFDPELLDIDKLGHLEHILV